MAAPCQRHGKGLNDDGVEVQDAWVKVDRAERAAGDYDRLEFAEHWLHGQAGIQAAQLQQILSTLRVQLSQQKCRQTYSHFCSRVCPL